MRKFFDFKSYSKAKRAPILTISGVILAYIIMEILISAGAVSSLIEGILVPVCVYSLAALGLNLCVGILGELSLGHAGFMCIGAFFGVITSKLLKPVISNDILLFICALIVGVIAAAIFGFLIGIPVLRLRGDYLAIVTLAFGEIIKGIVNVLYIYRDANGLHLAFGDKNNMVVDEATKEVILDGPLGLPQIPQLATFTIGIVLIVLALLLIYHFVNSRTGRAVMAIRDNRIAAESVGLNITGYKLLAFSVSAAIAGAAGVLYSHNLSTVTATSSNFGYNQSIMILVYVVLGGIGSIPGSIIAATILTILPEALRGFSTYRMLIYSIVLITVMLFTWSPKARDFKERMKLKFTKTFRRIFKKKEVINDAK